MLPKLVEKIKQVYVLTKLVDCIFATTSFMDVQGGTWYFCSYG